MRLINNNGFDHLALIYSIFCERFSSDVSFIFILIYCCSCCLTRCVFQIGYSKKLWSFKHVL